MCLPLSLYSLGSSLFLMLKDDEALDPVKLDFCEASSPPTPSEGLTFSSCVEFTPLTSGFLPNGLRKGGIAIYVNVLDQCNGVVYSCNVSVILVCGVHALKMLGMDL